MLSFVVDETWNVRFILLDFHWGTNSGSSASSYCMTKLSPRAIPLRFSGIRLALSKSSLKRQEWSQQIHDSILSGSQYNCAERKSCFPTLSLSQRTSVILDFPWFITCTFIHLLSAPFSLYFHLSLIFTKTFPPVAWTLGSATVLVQIQATIQSSPQFIPIRTG